MVTNYRRGAHAGVATVRDYFGLLPVSLRYWDM